MRRLLMATLLLGATTGMAIGGGAPCPIGTTVNAYRVCPIPNGFTSILGAAGTVNVHLPPADDANVVVPLPAGFVFNFFRTAATSANICTNGFVNFGTVQTAYLNAHAGDAAYSSGHAQPWFDDLLLTAGNASSVDWNYAPVPDTLTVQWSSMATWGGPGVGVGSFTFQAIFHGSASATPDAIDFRYDRTTAPTLMAPCTRPINVTGVAESATAVTATIGVASLGASAVSLGVDGNERGAASDAFPASDLRFLPTTYADGPLAYEGDPALAAADPWCSILGLPGTVVVGPPCGVGPCYDDEMSTEPAGVEIPLPWKFTLFGRQVKTAEMSANGVVRLGPGMWDSLMFANAVIGGAATHFPEPEATLAPFWDDLEGVSTSVMAYRVDGAPGCRTVTFEWAHFAPFAGVAGDCLVVGGDISFQARIYEGSAGPDIPGTCPPATVPGDGNDRVEYHYDHVGFVPPPAATPFTATIGIENWKGNATVGGSLAGSPAIAAPPLLPTGAPAKVVIDQCDQGTIRYYGDANNNAPVGAAACVPEMRHNAVPPRIGNPFGLGVIGASPASFAVLILDFGGPIPGTKTPVPCGGFPSPFGVLWTNPFLPSSLLLPCGLTSPGPPGSCEGSCKLDLPIPADPTLVGAKIFAQYAVVGVAAFGLRVELTEGAKIVLGV